MLTIFSWNRSCMDKPFRYVDPFESLTDKFARAHYATDSESKAFEGHLGLIFLSFGLGPVDNLFLVVVLKAAMSGELGLCFDREEASSLQ